MVKRRHSDAHQRTKPGKSHRKTVPLQSLPFPLALFVKGRLTACNETFRSVFPEPAGKAPLTLTRFLGREGKTRLKSLGWDEDTPTGSRMWHLSMELRTQSEGTREFDVDVAWTVDQDPPTLQILLRDVTDQNSALRELRHTREQLTSLFESLPVALGLVEGDAIIGANKALAVLLGYKDVMDVVGRTLSSHVAAKFRASAADHHRKVIEDHLADRRIEFQALRKDRTGFPAEEVASYIQSGGDSLLVLLRDITPLQEEKRRISFELDEWRNLDEILKGVRHTMDITDTCRVILENTLGVLSYEFGMLYLPEAMGPLMTAAIEINVPHQMLDHLRQQPAGQGIIGWVIKTEEPFTSRMEEYPAHLPYRSLFETSGVRAIAYIPLRAYGSIHGVLMLGSTRAKAQPESELRVLKHLTDHLGARIVAAQRYTSLKQHAARIETIVAGIPHILYQCSPSGVYTYLSPIVRELVGYGPADFYRNPDLWRNLLHPDDRSVFSQRVTGHVPGHETIRLEYRILPKGKATYHWLQDEIQYLRDGEGAVAGFTGSITDISERRNIDAISRLSLDVLQILASRVLSCYAVIDKNLFYLLWDDCLEQVTGIPRTKVLYRRAESATAHLMTPAAVEYVRQALSGTTVEVAEELSWSRFEPLRKNTGEILGVLCQFRNQDTPR
jgi:PAS domain S-box-containing protein